jgi:hypothetical protein
MGGRWWEGVAERAAWVPRILTNTSLFEDEGGDGVWLAGPDDVRPLILIRTSLLAVPAVGAFEEADANLQLASVSEMTVI